MGRIDVDYDLELFSKQVGWAAGVADDKELIEVVRWICLQLSRDETTDGMEALSRFLLRLLRLDTPEQIEAEKRLVSLLSRSFHSKVVHTTVADVPGRDVDWSETYARSLTGRPTRFVSRDVERRPDDQLMGALLYQAQQWSDVLKTSGRPSHQERADQLSQVVDQHPRRTELRLSPLSQPMLQRLQQKGEEARQAAVALSRVLSYQHSRPQRLVDAVTRAVDSSDGWWSGEAAADQSAWNGLLEFSVLSAITQTAARSAAWNLCSLDTQKTYRARLEHRFLPLQLTVQKSAPVPDVFTQIRQEAGMTKNQTARDSQPDICLTFSNVETEASISVLGDTKRNASLQNEGADLFRDGLRTATYYLSAYGKALDTQFSEQVGPRGAIRPTFTLFFRQGTETKDRVREALRKRASRSIPPILACDIENHFDLEGSVRNSDVAKQDEDWHSDFLVDWFDCISTQAVSLLHEP